MTPDDYRAIEDAMREKWPATVAPQFRRQPRKRWVPTETTPRNDTQVQIYGLLVTPMTARDIGQALGMTQQAMSYNIRILKRDGLIRSTGTGSRIDPKMWQRVEGRLL